MNTALYIFSIKARESSKDRTKLTEENKIKENFVNEDLRLVHLR